MDFQTFFADVSEFASASPINIMLMVGFVGLLVLLIANEISRLTRGVKEVTSAKVVQIMNQGGTIVDVRSNGDYDKTHIVNAKNIPLAELEKKQSQLAKDIATVLYCGPTGNEAVKAAVQLKKSGFTDVYVLKGGLPSWQEDKMPVVNAKTKSKDKTKQKNKNKKKENKPSAKAS